MMVKYSTLAAASALLVLAGTVPAAAFTHHPATPEEIRQTGDGLFYGADAFHDLGTLLH